MAVSVVVWGVSVWLLQKVWPCALGGLNLNLSSSIFYGWGLMLEDPPEEPPSNLTGQMAVGWWLAACLVLGSSYRSSLISHLVVAGKSPVINTVEDLVGRHGWGWGTPRMTGALKTVLSTSPDLAMQKFYKEMQTLRLLLPLAEDARAHDSSKVTIWHNHRRMAQQGWCLLGSVFSILIPYNTNMRRDQTKCQLHASETPDTSSDPPSPSQSPPALPKAVISPPPALLPDVSFQNFRECQQKWMEYSTMVDLLSLPLEKQLIQCASH
ncbi:hypothetical protein Pcinc_010610 [Petrolisthes cinctipes]|uniref:Ionotropic glutamate receptor C-terminal domain-containing protein n=1 Tax=Petrolisthes cinctipes TaxID=88211 RepID=A0AAE1KV72_PETCI|nr:hypothetical protein Pcinc_010610 [Petrolisthes cinctipes]